MQNPKNNYAILHFSNFFVKFLEGVTRCSVKENLSIR